MASTRTWTLACTATFAIAACSADDAVVRSNETIQENALDEETPTSVAPGSTARGHSEGPEPEAGAPLVFTNPGGWVEETPSSGMRRAQYRLPGEPAGADDAQLVVYHFGAGGGTVQANLDRWATQFEQPDGGSSMDKMLHAQRRVDGMLVHDVELSGTYVAETAPGSGVRVNKERSCMLASIIESDHGSYYVKLVGDQATVDHWKSSYRRFVTQAKRRR